MGLEQRHIILGIDPSLRGTGIGIIKVQQNKISCLFHETVKISRKIRFAQALSIIANEVEKEGIIFQPDAAAIEQPPYVQSISVLRTLSAVYGAVVETLEDMDIPVYEFTPMQIKQSSTGYGKAEKDSVQRYIQWILSLKEKPEPDSADALAAALTLANNYNQLIPARLNRL